MDQLDAADDKWQDEFLLEVSGLTVDDLNDLSFDELDQLADLMEKEEDERQISGDIVYLNFDKDWRHHSLRALLTHQETEFLLQSDPDWENDPDDHYVTGTAERTLLNADGEIMVDGMLYKFMPNGLIYEVVDGDFQTLRRIGPEHATTVFEADNVNVYNMDAMYERRACRTWVREKYSIAYTSRFKFKGITGHRSLIFSNRVYSTVRHYKWKRGKWKRRRGHLKTNNWGMHGTSEPGGLNANCDQQINYKAGERSKFRRRLTSRHETFGWGFGKIESGKVHAYHEANGRRKTIILEF